MKMSKGGGCIDGGIGEADSYELSALFLEVKEAFASTGAVER